MTFYTKILPSNTLCTQNQSYLWFSGTGYLGMAHHPIFKQHFVEAIEQLGTSWGSSRNNTVRLEVYDIAEQALASFFDAPASLTVASGMWAGQLAQKFWQLQGYSFEYAPKTHPALWTDNSYIPTIKYAEWAERISEKIRHHASSKIVICSDSVGSPYVEAYSFDWIQQLPPNKEIVVIIDASHSLGIQNLNDLLASSPIFETNSNVNILITSSLNKAMGMTGGIILGNVSILKQIKSTPMFSGASPMMPALLKAFTQSTGIYKVQKQILLQRIELFNQLLETDYLDSIRAYPAYCTHREGLHEYLLENGIMTSCFPYPTVHDQPVSRLVISALHHEDDIRLLAKHCNEFSS